MRGRSIGVCAAAAVTVAAAPEAAADSLRILASGPHHEVTVGFDTPAPDGRAQLLRGGAVLLEGTRSADGRVISFQDAQLATGDVLHVYRDGALHGSMTYSGGPQITGACAGTSRFTAVAEPGFAIAGMNAFFSGPSGDWDDNPPRWRRGTNPAAVTVDRPLVLGEQVGVRSEADTFWPAGGGRPLTVVSGNLFTVATLCSRPVLRALARSVSRRDRAQLARTRRFTVPFTAVAAGTTRVRLTTRAQGRTITLGAGSRTRSEPGTVRLAVRVTRAGRALLSRSARVRVRVVASFAPTGGRPTSTTARFTLG